MYTGKVKCHFLKYRGQKKPYVCIEQKLRVSKCIHKKLKVHVYVYPSIEIHADLWYNVIQWCWTSHCSLKSPSSQWVHVHQICDWWNYCWQHVLHHTTKPLWHASPMSLLCHQLCVENLPIYHVCNYQGILTRHACPLHGDPTCSTQRNWYGCMLKWIHALDVFCYIHIFSVILNSSQSTCTFIQVTQKLSVTNK